MIRRALAVLQALIMMSSSMMPSLMSPGAVDWRMKTAHSVLVLTHGLLGGRSLYHLHL